MKQKQRHQGRPGRNAGDIMRARAASADTERRSYRVDVVGTAPSSPRLVLLSLSHPGEAFTPELAEDIAGMLTEAAALARKQSARIAAGQKESCGPRGFGIGRRVPVAVEIDGKPIGDGTIRGFWYGEGDERNATARPSPVTGEPLALPEAAGVTAPVGTPPEAQGYEEHEIDPRPVANSVPYYGGFPHATPRPPPPATTAQTMKRSPFGALALGMLAGAMLGAVAGTALAEDDDDDDDPPDTQKAPPGHHLGGRRGT